MSNIDNFLDSKLDPMEYWIAGKLDDDNHPLEMRPIGAAARVTPESVANLFRLTDKNRLRENVYRRHYFSHYCRMVLKMPLTGVGAALGKDHATIKNSCKVHNDLAKDSLYLEYTEALREAMTTINTYRKSSQWRNV